MAGTRHLPAGRPTPVTLAAVAAAVAVGPGDAIAAAPMPPTKALIDAKIAAAERAELARQATIGAPCAAAACCWDSVRDAPPLRLFDPCSLWRVAPRTVRVFSSEQDVRRNGFWGSFSVAQLLPAPYTQLCVPLVWGADRRDRQGRHFAAVRSRQGAGAWRARVRCVGACSGKHPLRLPVTAPAGCGGRRRRDVRVTGGVRPEDCES